MQVAKRPKVSVCVVTYNHEKYIGECLQSLVNQEADFDFEVIVSDDCSVDQTRKVILDFAERYPAIVKPIFPEENLGAVKNYLFAHEMASGEYIAHMDGDDYALPGKLQAQARYLDAHLECAIVWHRMRILDGTNGSVQDDLIHTGSLPLNGFSQSQILALGSVACHSSKMYRSNNKFVGAPLSQFLDFLIDVEQLSSGNGQYLDGIFGVYRANVGVSRDNLKTRVVLLANLKFLSAKYPSARRSVSAHYLRLALSDLIHRRATFRDSVLGWLSVFHPASAFDLFLLRKYTRMFRSPL